MPLLSVKVVVPLKVTLLRWISTALLRLPVINTDCSRTGDKMLLMRTPLPMLLSLTSVILTNTIGKSYSAVIWILGCLF